MNSNAFFSFQGIKKITKILVMFCMILFVLAGCNLIEQEKIDDSMTRVDYVTWYLDDEFGTSNYFQLTTDYYGTIVINKSNVTFDLGNHTIYGNLTCDGIDIINKTNVVIRNGYIRTCYKGVYMYGGSGHTVSNIRVLNSATEGFRIHNVSITGTGTSFTSCYAGYNGDEGFHPENCQRLTFTSCYSYYNSSEGFRVESCSYSTFTSVTSYYNNIDGFDFNYGGYNSMNSVSSHHNRFNGIEFDYAGYVTVSDSSATFNGQHGLSVSNNSYSVHLIRCNANDNGGDGIHIYTNTTYSSAESCKGLRNTGCGCKMEENVRYCTITNNEFSSNKEDGINLSNYTCNNTYSYNTVLSNTRDGFHIRSNSNNNTIRANIVTGNGDDNYDDDCSNIYIC